MPPMSWDDQNPSHIKRGFSIKRYSFSFTFTLSWSIRNLQWYMPRSFLIRTSDYLINHTVVWAAKLWLFPNSYTTVPVCKPIWGPNRGWSTCFLSRTWDYAVNTAKVKHLQVVFLSFVPIFTYYDRIIVGRSEMICRSLLSWWKVEMGTENIWMIFLEL